MGSAIVTSTEVLISKRHSVVIEFLILIRKNLCSRLISEEILYENELFVEIKFHLHEATVDHVPSVHRFFIIIKKFVIPDNLMISNNLMISL